MLGEIFEHIMHEDVNHKNRKSPLFALPAISEFHEGTAPLHRLLYQVKKKLPSNQFSREAVYLRTN